MFGGNTGRQGIFNPEDETQLSMAIQRLMELQSTYGDTLQYGYSGKTKVAPGDSMGYAQYQNAITEADNITRTLQGQDPRGIRNGGQTNRSPMLGIGTLPGQKAPLQGNMPLQGQGNAPMQGLNNAGADYIDPQFKPDVNKQYLEQHNRRLRELERQGRG